MMNKKQQSIITTGVVALSLLAGCSKNGLQSIETEADSKLSMAKSLDGLNIFTWLNSDDVFAQVQKLEQRDNETLPLRGVLYVAKDNIDTDFMPTSGGTPALRGKTPPTSAPVIEKLQNAGAILLGKTNMHELAFGITSNNAAFGPVRNPYNINHIAGGSSGGTAAAIAAGLVEVGLGTDTGGSMRIPAALCGIYGFRPTIGRYDSAGVIPLSHTRDTVGVMASDMTKLIKFDAVLSGEQNEPTVHLNKLRIGIPHEYFHEDLHPDVKKQLAKLAKTLETEGVELVYEDIKNISALNQAVSFPVVIYEVARDLPAYLERRGQIDFNTLLGEVAGADVKGILTSATGEGAVPENVYQEVLTQHRPALQKAYRTYFNNHQLDAMLVMTTPLPAAKIGEDETTVLNGQDVPTFPTFIRNTDPASNAGIAAITIPVGVSEEGLPIGAELIGLAHSDRRLLQIAAKIGDSLDSMPSPKL